MRLRRLLRRWSEQWRLGGEAMRARNLTYLDTKAVVTNPEALRRFAADMCTVPPRGWWCSRRKGHDGPCAARRVV